MGISGFFGKRNISNLQIELEFLDEIYAQEEFPLKVLVYNKKKFLPSFLIKIYINEKEVLIPYIKNNSYAEKEVLYSFEKRGINKIENIHYCSVFPFNFFIRCFPSKKEYTKVVFPKPLKCNYFEEKEGKKKKEKEGRIRSYEGEIGGVKEYIQGEPLKFIHWKAYAKTGQLFIKELYTEGEKPVIIDFEKLKSKDIEKSLSCATYLIINYHRLKIPVGLKIGKKIFKPDLSYGHKLSMLKELSLYV
jgi:uncharacterized protein (DUF58 family)